MGLSMGGCLALRLAETHGPDVRGLVLVNPSLAPDTKLFLIAPVLKHLVRSMPAIGSDIRKPGAVELCYDRVPARAAATLPRRGWRTAQDLPHIARTGAGVPEQRRPRGRAAQHAGAGSPPAARIAHRPGLS